MRSKQRAPGRRASFTLLEVVLATAIGLVLMAALYAAMSVQLNLAQVSRTRIDQSALARAVLARMADDISANVGPISAASLAAAGLTGGSGNGSSTPATGGAGAGAGSAGGGAGAGSAGGGGAAGGAASSNANGSTGTTTNTLLINLGVQGDQTHVVLYVTRLARELDSMPNGPNGDGTPAGVCDLRRVTYWLVSGGSGGLARQELKTVTSDDMNAIPPDNLPNDESTYIIAEEIKNLAFSYFDGNNWNDSWDGTTPGNDGVTPIGPPMAIAIEIGVQFPGSSEVKKYRQVVPILAANGQGNPPPPSNPPASSSSSSSNNTAGP
jgi:hypothetical protein